MLAAMMLLHPLGSHTAQKNNNRRQPVKQLSPGDDPATMLLLKGMGAILFVPQEVACIQNIL